MRGTWALLAEFKVGMAARGEAGARAGHLVAIGGWQGRDGAGRGGAFLLIRAPKVINYARIIPDRKI